MQERDPLWEEHRHVHHRGDWVVVALMLLGLVVVHRLFVWGLLAL